MGLCDDIRNQIRKDVQSAMNQARNETNIELDENILSYYASGSPIVYKRTGTLPNAANVTPVFGGGNSYSYMAEVDGGRIGYSTGTFSGSQVVQATEEGTSGVLGQSGYWKKTDAEIPNIVDSALASKFG